MKTELDIQSLLEKKKGVASALESSSGDQVVLSTRVRLARNLEDVPFPGWAKKSQRREILTICMDAVATASEMKDGLQIEIDGLSDLEKQILLERRFISRELAQHPKQAGVCISADQSCAIMVNEEDHLRIQMVSEGFDFKRVWAAVDKIDSEIEEHLDFAFSPDLGYLTACPTNVGTGLRASAMMHLPGLVMSKQMEKVIRAVNQLGMAVRGIFGEGSDAIGSIFQISNQQTLGEMENDILNRLENVLEAVIRQERNAREKLVEAKFTRLRDEIGRAYGILKGAYLLSSSESIKLLSLLRLGVDLGFLPVEHRTGIDRLFIEGQPGHIQYFAKDEIDPGRRDEFRAGMVREHFSDLPLLNFDKG